MPSLIVLAFVNNIKFNSYLPFSYGGSGGNTDISKYTHIVGAIILMHLVFFLYKHTEEAFLPKLRKPLIAVMWAIIALIFTIISVPLISGIGVILFDMTLLDQNILEVGMLRGYQGEVLYLGRYKKAFIQSFPLFYISLLPLFLKKFRSDISSFYLYWIYLIPFSFLLVFCSLQWHGGVSLDMRYLLPTLPFLIAEFISAFRLLKDNKYDIIHAHWILPQGFIGVLLSKLFYIPCIVTIHGGDIFALRGRLLSAFKKYALKNANLVTVNSKATYDLFREFF